MQIMKETANICEYKVWINANIAHFRLRKWKHWFVDIAMLRFLNSRTSFDVMEYL